MHFQLMFNCANIFLVLFPLFSIFCEHFFCSDKMIHRVNANLRSLFFTIEIYKLILKCQW